MPTYTIKDIKSQDVWDVRCSYQDLQSMLNSNPNMILVLSAPALVSGSMSNLKRAGSEWRDLLGKIKKGSNKDNTIND